MVTDAFCSYVLALFLQAQPSWCQLHVADPGPDGMLGGAVERSRREIRWGRLEGSRVFSQNPLMWDRVAGVPGFPQTICYLSVWSAPEGGMCWMRTPVVPVRVPHEASLEIPAGICLDVSPFSPSDTFA